MDAIPTVPFTKADQMHRDLSRDFPPGLNCYRVTLSEDENVFQG